MNFNPDPETIIKIANILYYQYTGKPLSAVQKVLVNGLAQDLSYAQMSQTSNYSVGYLCKDTGTKFYSTFSKIVKEKVTKRNFRDMVLKLWHEYTQDIFNQNRNQLEHLPPNNFVNVLIAWRVLNNEIYVERSPIENTCYQTISQPGACLWIKAAYKMGKTSLVKQIFQFIDSSTRGICLDFGLVDGEIIQDKSKLLRLISTVVFQHLNSEDEVQDGWDRDLIEINDNNDCTSYFENHILAKIEDELILALENIDELFDYPEVTEFLTLLSSWHQKGQDNSHWSKLKLIVTQSTEEKIPQNIDRSLLDIGTPILLEGFNFQHAKQLADLYQLDWEEREISRLINKVKGNPYLLNIEMQQAKNTNILRFSI